MKICEVEGCTKSLRCKGLCKSHYSKLWGGSSEQIANTTARRQNYYNRNKEKIKLQSKNWSSANVIRRKEIGRRGSETYRNKNLSKTKMWCKTWAVANPGKINAYSAHRRAYKLQATPPWADLAKISEIYQNCPKGYHVDHILPLKSKYVCGLHIPENLQYLPASENLRKHNKVYGKNL